MPRQFLSWLASIRLRTLFRLVFLLLALATIALALTVLREEKQQSFDNYRDRFAKTSDQVAARLRHPTGQLALLNPHSGGNVLTPLRPMLLPYGALDFDDHNKVRNAVDMAGCQVQYPRDASICVAIGSNPWAGGFIYVVGRLKLGDLQAHLHGDRNFLNSHRVRVEVALRGEQYAWMAPLELETDGQPAAGKSLRARLTGFIERPDGDYVHAVPLREFRGWLWQPACPGSENGATCEREVFYSLRLPVDPLRMDLAAGQPVWPPIDLNAMLVRVQVFSPGQDQALFDSNDSNARAPFLLSDLQSLLLPGESLHITRLSPSRGQDVLRMQGNELSGEEVWPLVSWLISKLPVETSGFTLQTREEISTPSGRYELLLKGDVRSANRILARGVTRVAWFVGAMLLAIFIAWLVIELGIMRRITVLTRRVRGVQRAQSSQQGLEQLDVSDLRGGDELGLLAACLHDLLRRMREDMEREKIRAEQEKDLWHAVGHEIMSPLQSLLALHNDPDNPSRRYLERMQQAVRVLYGSASPSEAFESTRLQIQALDLNAFLLAIARNAPCAGIDQVRYEELEGPLWVKADEYPLEDVVTHVLRNADRYRKDGSAIQIMLDKEESSAWVSIYNQGPHIAEDMLQKIFEYGVSEASDSAQGRRGQGLFVARTYMAKMGGTISVRNVDAGVEFVLGLPLA